MTNKGVFVSVLSNIQLREAIANGHIVCHPFEPKHVSQASLDVTLGYYYYRTERDNEKTIYDPFDSQDVQRYFEGPFKAIPHKDWCAQYGHRLIDGIPPEHPVIALRPGERILAHTHEFFGILPPGACELRSRSSWGRNGVAVCFDAGWIDPGYINRLTLEIFNLNKHEMVVLPVGERIAQAIFHETGEIEGAYGTGRNEGFSGKYQDGQDLDTIINIWSPDMMLPKAYLDSLSMPKKIEGLQYD